MKKYKVLFLDMDGTFLDFHAAEREAFGRALNKAGIASGEERYRLYSAVNDSLWKAYERGEIEKQEIRDCRFTKLFEALGISGDGIAVERDYELFLGEGHALIPDAREVLEYLYKKFPLYVVTNGFAAVQRNRLHLSGLDRLMKQVFISEEIGWQKPRKEFFEVCFARMEDQAAPEEILLIGDSLSSDIRGAKNAGIDSCWFCPDGTENGTDLRPDYKIRSLIELKELLR